ncbi:sensor domain-containing diguanylate cyclase [Marinobacter sp.]|uniref:sensor domain-containing diguanylate cyclase n=1 Tax=Marinobacter sp. TaxID=50741 RepID=UPI001A0D35D0|nr:sensor domain-containing diguanylate cyclase [Marinobacter sp.]MBE0486242.1 sensor domain-containing diguanylate cyclase [Marinobacter sp.]
MDIQEQERRIITRAIVAVVLTGIVIAVVIATPLINQMHTRAALDAVSVADAKTKNIQAIFDLHQDLAKQTASRSELARVLGEYARGQLNVDAVQDFSIPRLEDSARLIDNLAALIRYDADGNEIARVGPMASALPDTIPVPRQLDIQIYDFADSRSATPLMHTISTIQVDGEMVGTDLLLFSLSSMTSVFEAQSHTQMCLINADRTRRIEFEPLTKTFDIRPADTCLADKAGVSTDQPEAFFRSALDDGTRVLAFMRPLQGYEWQLHMYSEITRVFGNVTRDIAVSILAILLLSALAGLLVWRALRPVVQAMVEQASQIARSTEELQLAYQVFEHTHESIVICDLSFNIIRANPAFADIAGMTSKALKRKNLRDFLDTAQQRHQIPEDVHKQLIAENAWQGEVWLKMPDQSTFPNLLTLSPVRNNEGQLSQLVLTFSDITERVKAEKQMLRLAHYDKLTGLPNRAALETHLEQAIEQARQANSQFALMFLDLDKFKPVNDTYGHQVGDELLRMVAKRLKHCIRSSDVVGRRGGDEFVVITGPIYGDDNARPVAEKIVAVLNDVFHTHNHNIQIGVSVGVAVFPNNGVTADDLLKAADGAMYRVKAGGRNAVAYA